MGVSGVNSNSAASSIYGSRNVLSGLASGMDTESMIENAISGMQTKIQNLQRSRTKSEWKMEAMRNISDAMVQFARKYTSYTSSTNLLSPSFFEKAVITTAQGANSKYVTASGKSNSDIEILGIEQLATNARYSTDSEGVLSQSTGKITADKAIALGGMKDLSTIDGMLTLNYGNKRVSISLDELETFQSDTDGGSSAAEKLAAAIKEKLGDEKIIMSDGSQKAASDLIKVSVSDSGEISFSDAKDAGNSVYISSVSGNFGKIMDVQTGEESKSFQVPGDSELVTKKQNMAYLSGKSMKVTWNGITKSIDMPKMKEIKDTDGTLTGYKIGDTTVTLKDKLGQVKSDADLNKEMNETYVKETNSSLAHAFGAGNVTVRNAQEADAALPGDPPTTADGTMLQLEFSVKSGSTLAIDSKFGEVLGMSDSETSYLNTGKTLEDLGIDFAHLKNARIGANLDADTEPTEVKNAKGERLYFADKDGNRVAKDDDGKWYLADSEDSILYNLEVNGVNIGRYSKNTALETVMVDINNNAEAGVKVSYSKLTNEMVFTAKETGAGGQIEIKNEVADDQGNNLAAKIFGEIGSDSDGFKAGTDAKVTVKINGSDEMELVRSTNNFDLEGLSVTLKDKFGNYDSAGKLTGDHPEAITFKTESDTEKIVDAVKSMVEDYNEMIKGIKEAYSTMPAQKSNGSKYEPLVDDETADLSETALKNYEEKAKQGILFADQDLSSLYSKLRNVFSASGADGAYLRKIGITTNYSEGLTTVELDETALKDALNSNPDAVKEAFTKTKGAGGATSDGIMQGLKDQLDAYASTTGGYKGILIEKAGSKYSATSLLSNSYQTELDGIDKQIDKWEDKISDKVDYYTNKFSKLEQLIAQMNSQSSYLQNLQSGG